MPDNMADATCAAIANLRNAVGGDIIGFVCERLRMSRAQLYEALMIEQVEGVALAIYNIEARQQGLIIGDQTGVGKGRQAAAIVRYAIQQGMMPIFITARAYLFSDFYRDAKALGISNMTPFVVNSDARVVDYTQAISEYEEPIRAEDESEDEFDARMVAAQAKAYKVVFRGADKELMTSQGIVPPEVNYIMSTYSQFNRARRAGKIRGRGVKVDKGAWLLEVARQRPCVFILDESHTAAGLSSNTGVFFRKALSLSKGALFLSATFAKRPENMSVYAAKTVIGEANMSPAELSAAMKEGGVPMQELLARNLARYGQMIRRERQSTGVTVRYISMDKAGAEEFGIADTSVEDCANADVVTAIIRRMVRFQHNVVQPIANTIEVQEATKLESDFPECTVSASCISPYERLFLLIESMLLAVKARNIALRTLMHIREGRKVVICVSKTGESTLRSLCNADGTLCSVGQEVDGGFRSYLKTLVETLTQVRIKCDVKEKEQLEALKQRGFQSVGNANALVMQKVMDVNSMLSPADRAEMQDVLNIVDSSCVELPLSPIDFMRYYIEREGISVGECTGRQLRLRYDSDNVTHAQLETRRHADVSATFNQFQNNDIDVMIINSSASTGASCHAVPTQRVAPDKVKQRVMIIAQPELDVSVEVQKRGRVNRTGQLESIPPIYEYITSAIPAEQRILMSLKRKLKSLDANTTANQRQNDQMLDYPDFMNQYGDEYVASTWMGEHPDECEAMDLGEPGRTTAGLASKVAGRIAALSCQSQDDFYRSMYEGYDEAVRRAKAEGSYNLECERMDLQAKECSETAVSLGFGGAPFFGGDVLVKEYQCMVTTRPYKVDDILTHIEQDIATNGTYEGMADQVKLFYESQIKDVSETLAKKLEDKTLKPEAINDLYSKAKQKIALLGEQSKAVSYLMTLMASLCKGTGNNPQKRALRGTFRILRVDGDPTLATLVGVRFANRAKPFLPSSVVAVFDVCDASQRTEMNCVVGEGRGFERLKQLFSTCARPFDNSKATFAHFTEIWNQLRVSNQRKLVKRAIMTGNLISAFGLRSYSAVPKHAIYYTTEDGRTHTGLMLCPDYQRLLFKANKGSTGVSLPLSDMVIDKLMSAAVNTQLTSCHGSFVIQSERRGTKWDYLPDGTRKLGVQMGYNIMPRKGSEMDEFMDEQPEVAELIDRMAVEGFHQPLVLQFLKMLAPFHFAVILPVGLFAKGELDKIRADVQQHSDPWPKLTWDPALIPQQ